MTPEAIEKFYLEHGYVKNRYGKWVSPSGIKRVVITERILRIEKKITYQHDGTSEWIRLRSAYLSGLTIENGRIKWKFF